MLPRQLGVWRRGFYRQWMTFVKMIQTTLGRSIPHSFKIRARVFSLPLMTSNLSFKKYLGMGTSNCCWRRENKRKTISLGSQDSSPPRIMVGWVNHRDLLGGWVERRFSGSECLLHSMENWVQIPVVTYGHVGPRAAWYAPAKKGFIETNQKVGLSLSLP